MEVPRPLPRSFCFPKSTGQNSEIAVLFSIVEKPNNYVFGDDLLPKVPVRGPASYKLWLVLHIVMIIGKCTDVFRGILWLGGGVEKRGVMWGEHSMEEFVMGEFFYKGDIFPKKISINGTDHFLALFKKTMKK